MYRAYVIETYFHTTCSCIGVSNRAILVRPRSDFRNDVTIFFLHHTESPIDLIETDAGLKLNMHRLHRHISRVRQISSILISHHMLADNESRHAYVILLFETTIESPYSIDLF